MVGVLDNPVDSKSGFCWGWASITPPRFRLCGMAGGVWRAMEDAQGAGVWGIIFER